ncbi:hypothetical protein HDU89_000500 [Geranomyces variabilis]|nr:hypothetical protein HDU89_000500 [Geranomyces variabilis]
MFQKPPSLFSTWLDEKLKEEGSFIFFQKTLDEYKRGFKRQKALEGKRWRMSKSTALEAEFDQKKLQFEEEQRLVAASEDLGLAGVRLRGRQFALRVEQTAKRSAPDLAHPLTPPQKKRVFPTVQASPAAEADAEESDDEEEILDKSMEVMTGGMRKLKNRSKEMDMVVNGINLQRTLLHAQQQIVRDRLKISKANSFVYLAARGCLLIDKAYPRQLRNIVDKAEYAKLQLQLSQEFACEPATAGFVEKRNLGDFAQLRTANLSELGLGIGIVKAKKKLKGFE